MYSSHCTNCILMHFLKKVKTKIEACHCNSQCIICSLKNKLVSTGFFWEFIFVFLLLWSNCDPNITIKSFYKCELYIATYLQCKCNACKYLELGLPFMRCSEFFPWILTKCLPEETKCKPIIYFLKHRTTGTIKPKKVDFCISAIGV